MARKRKNGAYRYTFSSYYLEINKQLMSGHVQISANILYMMRNQLGFQKCYLATFRSGDDWLFEEPKIHTEKKNLYYKYILQLNKVIIL